MDMEPSNDVRWPVASEFDSEAVTAARRILPPPFMTHPRQRPNLRTRPSQSPIPHLTDPAIRKQPDDIRRALKYCKLSRVTGARQENNLPR